MKRSDKLLIGLITYGVVLTMIQFLFPDSPISLDRGAGIVLLNVLILALLFFIGIFYKIEEKSLNAKETAFIAIYSAFTAAVRVPFVGIPGVQPCSYLIFISGYVFGPLIGFVVGGNTALLSNIILGHGPWTVYQIYGWGIFGILGGVIGKLYERRGVIINRWVMSIIGFIFGFVYGWLLNSWFYILTIRPITLAGFLLFNLTSFIYDLAHAIGNVIFFFYFGEKTIGILQRYRNRFSIVIIQPKKYGNKFT